jgi:hypothetical protein
VLPAVEPAGEPDPAPGRGESGEQQQGRLDALPRDGARGDAVPELARLGGLDHLEGAVLDGEQRFPEDEPLGPRRRLRHADGNAAARADLPRRGID